MFATAERANHIEKIEVRSIPQISQTFERQRNFRDIESMNFEKGSKSCAQGNESSHNYHSRQGLK